MKSDTDCPGAKAALKLGYENKQTKTKTFSKGFKLE